MPGRCDYSSMTTVPWSSHAECIPSTYEWSSQPARYLYYSPALSYHGRRPESYRAGENFLGTRSRCLFGYTSAYPTTLLSSRIGNRLHANYAAREPGWLRPTWRTDPQRPAGIGNLHCLQEMVQRRQYSIQQTALHPCRSSVELPAA